MTQLSLFDSNDTAADGFALYRRVSRALGDCTRVRVEIGGNKITAQTATGVVAEIYQGRRFRIVCPDGWPAATIDDVRALRKFFHAAELPAALALVEKNVRQTVRRGPWLLPTVHSGWINGAHTHGDTQ